MEIIGKTYVNNFVTKALNFANFAPKAHNFTNLSKLQLAKVEYLNNLNKIVSS